MYFYIFRRHRISDSAYCDRCIRAWSVRPSVCLLHPCTLLKPLDGIRWHLAGRTCEWPKVTLCWKGPSPLREMEIWGRNPNRRHHSAAANSKHLYYYSLDVSICVAAMQPIAKSLWPLLYGPKFLSGTALLSFCKQRLK